MIILCLGCFIMAVGLNMFLEPYTIASGGLTGLAIVFKSLFNTPLWLINLAFNIPLFIIGIKILGKRTKNLPFEVNEDQEVREDLRLQYRFLDLRSEKLKNNLRLS